MCKNRRWWAMCDQLGLLYIQLLHITYPLISAYFEVTRHLCCKIRHLLHVSLNNSTARPSFKNMYNTFLTKWSKLPKVCFHVRIRNKHTFDIFGHLVKKGSYTFLKDGLAVKLLRETWKRVGFLLNFAA